MNKQDAKNDTCNSRTALIQFHKGKKARKLTAFWFLSLQQEGSKHNFGSKRVHGILSQATNKNTNVRQVTSFSNTKEKEKRRARTAATSRKVPTYCNKIFKQIQRL